MEVMHYISAAKAEQRKLFAWLVDPEKAESSGQWLVVRGRIAKRSNCQIC